jgi:predicted DNA-binding protein YlxM (UPF0122 family)
MDNIFEKTLLYDFYGELLTERQKNIYELYNLHDLSLGEISEQMNISRQGVYDALKRCDKQLNNYESKLKLITKFLNNKNRVNKIHEITIELEANEEIDRSTIMNKIKNIKILSNEILEDL